jgi:hypothetical protein
MAGRAGRLILRRDVLTEQVEFGSGDLQLNKRE